MSMNQESGDEVKTSDKVKDTNFGKQRCVEIMFIMLAIQDQQGSFLNIVKIHMPQ